MDRILKNKTMMIALAMALGCVVIYFLMQTGHDPVEPDDIFAEAALEGDIEKSEKNDLDDVVIKVDVKGAVEKPGIFTAQAGDRVIDMISAAGNFTDKADKDKVNFAQLVEDQMVIYVPEIGEEEGALGQNNLAPSGGMNAGQVNLNTATQEELETLTGIGPSKATAILEYRESVGKFKQIDELKKVSGIGDKTFEKLQDSISVR
ncbi:helix-hairpin-helix domain-containing protein [Peribacillus muralis]|uniref:helix-hairpin-helix domain-containing protein n=1 Tax=Peribacillus muralis TaxID=264697 RepID=UPI00070FEBFA|nr:helix-hairpin-helix domain-containing protein [Peribacillus muralis]